MCIKLSYSRSQRYSIKKPQNEKDKRLTIRFILFTFFNVSVKYSIVWGHALSTYAKLSEELKFLISWYAHVCVRIRELEMLAFWKILRTYLMNGL